MSDHGSICLKTGCLLEMGGYFYWGDLHSLNAATLVFNAVQMSGTAVYVDPLVYGDNACGLSYDGPLFERRGVFVLLTHCAEPNAALEQHFREWGGPR